MAETKTRVSLKGMSDEEKKERKKMQQREYMANRRKQDPEFAAKQKEFVRQHKKNLRACPEYLDKEKTYNKMYYEKRKREYEEMKLLLSSSLIGANK